MKVALVQQRIEAKAGGVWTFQETLTEQLARLAPSIEHEFGRFEIAEGTRQLLSKGLTRGLRVLQDDILELPRVVARTTAFERALTREQIDLVWFTGSYACEVDRPYILTLYDVEHLRQPWFPEVSANGTWRLRERFFSRYIEQATRVIVPNQAGRDQIVEHYRIGPERVLCLGHPTPTFALEAASRPVRPAPNVPGPYLLYPAQFWAHKDHPTLLEMLRLLPEYRLVLVGSDKGQADRVRHLAARMGVTDRVTFAGFVEVDDLVALYQHAHALVYASLFGPENLPPLEACALGCPAIVADVPGASEQLGDAALRVSPQDPSAFAAAVRELESTDVRERQIARGHARATRGGAADYVGGVLNFIDEFERTLRCWA